MESLLYEMCCKAKIIMSFSAKLAQSTYISTMKWNFMGGDNLINMGVGLTWIHARLKVHHTTATFLVHIAALGQKVSNFYLSTESSWQLLKGLSWHPVSRSSWKNIGFSLHFMPKAFHYVTHMGNGTKTHINSKKLFRKLLLPIQNIPNPKDAELSSILVNCVWLDFCCQKKTFFICCGVDFHNVRVSFAGLPPESCNPSGASWRPRWWIPCCSRLNHFPYLHSWWSSITASVSIKRAKIVP